MGQRPKKSRVTIAFGRAVRKRREELGLSQIELAEAANLHRTYIGSVERGERNVGLENIVTLATALGATASSLLHGLGES